MRKGFPPTFHRAELVPYYQSLFIDHLGQFELSIQSDPAANYELPIIKSADLLNGTQFSDDLKNQSVPLQFMLECNQCYQDSEPAVAVCGYYYRSNYCMECMLVTVTYAHDFKVQIPCDNCRVEERDLIPVSGTAACLSYGVFPSTCLNLNCGHIVICERCLPSGTPGKTKCILCNSSLLQI